MIWDDGDRSRVHWAVVVAGVALFWLSFVGGLWLMFKSGLFD